MVTIHYSLKGVLTEINYCYEVLGIGLVHVLNQNQFS